MAKLLRPFPLIRGLDKRTCFIDRSLRIVVGLDSEAILIDGAVALAGNVEDLAKSNMAPDLNPLRLSISTQSVAIAVCCGLVVALSEEDLCDTVVRKRGVLICIERLLILGKCADQISLCNELLALQHGDAHSQIGRALEHP